MSARMMMECVSRPRKIFTMVNDVDRILNCAGASAGVEREIRMKHEVCDVGLNTEESGDSGCRRWRRLPRLNENHGIESDQRQGDARLRSRCRCSRASPGGLGTHVR